jgi:predicted metal-binding membrane protein
MELAHLPLPRTTFERSRIALIGALLALALVGWTVTDERMHDMDAGPGTELGTLGFFVTAWVVMMAAMMFPSIWPMVTMYGRVQQGKRERGQEVPIGATALFVSGYLVTWTAAGLIGYGIFEAAQGLSIDAFSWDRGGPYLAGGVIVVAAVYQLTPLKDACLSKCRSPLMFILTRWQPGRLGALRMGIEHGGWCVGCCWALMAALFALGVMSVGWMVFIAALIATEKLLPWKAIANRGIAVALVALGIAVAFVPEDVPGLILPGSPEAMRAMEAMEGGSMEGEGSGGGGGAMEGMKGMEDEGSGAGAGAGIEHESMGGEAKGGEGGAMNHEGAMKDEGATKPEGAMKHEGHGGAMPGQGMDHP